MAVWSVIGFATYVCGAWSAIRWMHKKCKKLEQYSTEEILTEFYNRLGTIPLPKGEYCTFNVKGLPSPYNIKRMSAAMDFGRTQEKPVTISWPHEVSQE